MKKKRVGIVGAGVGGLATAARLAQRGCEVEVFEKLPECGGRCHLLEDKGFKFDMGPSFVLMPDFFKEVFSYCGENLEDYLNLVALDPSYKIFFADGDTFTVNKDSMKTKEEVERIEPGAGKGFDDFVKETQRIYQKVRPLLYRCFTSKAAANPGYWGLIGSIRALESYWKLAKRFFKSDKLCYAFTFEAMFMGVSPFEAPAFYSVISYADHVQKVFHPLGGMYQIPRALEAMAKKYGARFYYNQEAKNIASDNGAVTLSVNGTRNSFDRAVVNADYAYTKQKLLGRSLPNYKYSCSVYLIYLGLKQKVQGLMHHNLFFAKDLRKNLDQIFHTQGTSEDFSFYVHVPTVTDPSLAPQGKDIVYILIPVANLQNVKSDDASGLKNLRRVVFDRLSRQLGSRLEDMIEVEHEFYPKDFITQYNILNAATFGLAHNLMQSAFFRPANFDSEIKGLYFAGASTQPGGGLPVVIASSRIVADLIDKSG